MARILLAEDEEALRGFIVRALLEEGHEVIAVADGASALDVLARDSGRFQLLLTDLRMPIMDGIALAFSAARDHPDLIILLMTGFADQRERAHELDALVQDVITKPFSIADIKHAVKGALLTHATR